MSRFEPAAPGAMVRLARDWLATRRAMRTGLAASAVAAWLLPIAPLVPLVLPASVAHAAPATKPPPTSETQRLDTAMARLSRNPRSVDALIEAGNAAAASGDGEAAIGFLRRAEQAAPADARALSGLAGALLRANDPVAALPLYARAERAGTMTSMTIADRGLAYDLVGDNVRAQRYYRQALTLSENPEATRRLALSQAIAGDGPAGDLTLRLLLQAQDKASWRTRAFIFAITGQVDEAITVARTLLPGELAAAITPYLRFMPRLTRAQQAAAANLGAFPQASAIGHDDPRIAQYVAGAGAPGLASADGALAPTGTPLGRRGSVPSIREDNPPRTQSRAERAAERAARIAPPEPPPAQQIPTDGAPPVVAAAQPAAQPTASTAGLTGVRVPQLAAIAERASAGPGTVVTPVPSRVAQRPSLADAFGDIGAPEIPSTPRAGAVDISRLAPVRPGGGSPVANTNPGRSKAKPALKPEPPSHPSRIWVQLGVGRDHAALVADWRRLLRQDSAVFKGQQPFVTDNGARDRMLTGPFETEAAARGFVAQLASAGIAGPYPWISPAGQVVDPLATR